MCLDIVRFADPQLLGRYSAQFRQGFVAAKGFSAQELDAFNAAKQGLKGAKLYSCKVLERNDSSELQRFSKKADFLAAKGFSPQMCSWAANSKGIKLLMQPFSPERCFIDLETANVLAGNGVFVVIFFSDFLEAKGLKLSQLIKNACACVKICTSAGAKIMLASGAKSEHQLRQAKDLSSFGVLLGMGREQALAAVRGNPKLLFLGGVK
ncbi:MAG TPA: hypothetical protein HA254_05170 [Candidatus Diapherotrites archaeon]|uniref:Uncharacterized protein n=1 Tax=Candidatus Iainarchaeum sp. TaxID=3101447 RepID=A0A7J4IX89_9ARCH|nr:hypothetical protein [Candidatus Diapherotrites archaeon]